MLPIFLFSNASTPLYSPQFAGKLAKCKPYGQIKQLNRAKMHPSGGRNPACSCALAFGIIMRVRWPPAKPAERRAFMEESISKLLELSVSIEGGIEKLQDTLDSMSGGG